MKLERPIAFFDLETTGTNTGTDRIISIAVKKIMPDGTADKRGMVLNPQVQVPKGASDVNGFTNEKIAEIKANYAAQGKVMPTFEMIAKSLYTYLSDCDFGGFMIINFDIPLLSEEFSRVGVDFPSPGQRFIDAGNIFKIIDKRTLVAALMKYCNENLEEAHTAEADVEASHKVLLAMIEKHAELKDLDVQGLADFSKMDERVDLVGSFVKDEEGKVIFAFGKHKGKRVAEIFKTDKNYYEWIINKSDMTSDTKRHAKRMYNLINPPKNS